MTDPLTQKVDLETPCLVLDLELLERNLQKMQAAADHAGKHLRPHVKTHKCSALARRQREVGAIGVCVAKVSEAEALVRAGLDAILVTGPVATAGKVERLVDLLPAAPSLMTVIDHPAHMDFLDAALRRRDLSMGVLLDVDVGLNRTGVKPSDASALAAKIVSCPSLQLMGIQAYAGQVQHLRPFEVRRETSHQCLKQAASIFRKLRSDVSTCSIFSASGTGTFDIDLSIPEVTELQVGSYACMDAEYLAIGSAEDDQRFTPFEAALRLLTTVVSTNQADFVTVDAGVSGEDFSDQHGVFP